MTTRIKLRRDTAANWTANNPILAAGEPGLETDTGKTKYGDGTTAWASLDYATGGITTREQIGYFTLTGPQIPNVNANYDEWFETVVADPDGNAYYVGGQNDGPNWIRVVKVDTTGEQVWEKEITWADGYEGAGTSAVYNTATDQLVMVAEVWKNTTEPAQEDECFAVITVNPTTGAIVGNPTVVRDDVISDGSNYGWMSPADIILTASGDPVVSGSKGGSAVLFPVTTQTGSTVDVLFVDALQFYNRYPKSYNNWYITGTNITSPLTITAVNRYYNQTTTALAHTGTGATFVLSDDGAGGYSVVSVAVPGTYYAVGNKITLLGSAFGGSDGVNDATITVSGVASGGVVTAATVNGTSFATAPVGGWTATGGTNIASGSNATFTAEWLMQGSDFYFVNHDPSFPYYGVTTAQAGTGYVAGDLLELPAASYGGVTTGTITVAAVGGSGEITGYSFTGTFNTSTVKLETAGYNFDFGVVGNWTVQNFNSEAFVWSPNWSVNFGAGDSDEAHALARDSQGNIYAASRSYDYSIGGDDRGLLVKISSTGTLVWNKNFDAVGWSGHNSGYTGVAVDSNDNVIVVQDEQITKVDGSGTVLWQKQVEPGAPFNMWNGCVDVDSDDNIYLVAEYDFMLGTTGDNFLIIKFDTDGNVLWQREAGTASNENSNWLDGHQIGTVQGNRFYIAGSSNLGNDDVGLGISLPTDGTGAREEFYGRYLYRETTWTVTTTTATIDVMEIGFQTAEVVAATTNTFSVTTVTNNAVELMAVRTGLVDGRINDLYSVTFEDGTVQRTAYTGGIAESGTSPRIYNTNDYTLNQGDSGRMIRWWADGWTDTVNIYVPNDSEVFFPTGTQIYFMKDLGIRAFMFWTGSSSFNNNDSTVTILPAQPESGMEGSAFNSGEGWSVHHIDQPSNGTNSAALVTLTKVAANRWLLSCNNATHVMDWWY